MKNRPFFFLSLLAMIASLVVMILMARATNQADLAKPEGYRSPILALEFAQDTPVVRTVFKWNESSKRPERANAMIRATNLDYWFILTYGSFMVLFALQCSRMGKQYPWVAAVIGVLAAAADVLENGQLKEIFSLVSKAMEGYSGSFPSPHFWASVKFFCTGAYFLALGPFFWKASPWGGKVVVLAGLGSLLCWALASFYRPECWTDGLFGLVILAFAGAMFFGLGFRVKSAPE